ncbi:YtxH domain-containing protein [Oceanobacillus salinisoli]|uniref:YtxH domain-containing protein n=1 Tax=Oceanobacillus salinisoli TaxID=2678611 RepID=UPI0012E195F6|nr:YtxH domain-containing protein [Oceanobacillus salinisoli]
MGDNNNINTKDFIIGTLVGTIVGASCALIFAPKSGRELRGDINQGALQAKDRAGDWKGIAQEKSADWKDKAFTTSAEIKKRAMDTTSHLTKNVSQKTQDFKKTLSSKFNNETDNTDQVNINEQAADDVVQKLEQ